MIFICIYIPVEKKKTLKGEGILCKIYDTILMSFCFFTRREEEERLRFEEEQRIVVFEEEQRRLVAEEMRIREEERMRFIEPV